MINAMTGLGLEDVDPNFLMEYLPLRDQDK